MQLFNAANSPYQIFILSTRAGGPDLNLQTADMGRPLRLGLEPACGLAGAGPCSSDWADEGGADSEVHYREKRGGSDVCEGDV